MADNQFVMGSELAVEPMLPDPRPSGVGRTAWVFARVVGGPGVRHGLLLVAVSAGLVGSAALLGHAANAPSLTRYESGHAGIAASLHAAGGVVTAGMLTIAGVAPARSLLAIGRRGMDGLSDERALRLGGDVALAIVLVALCLSLTADLVAGDLLTLAR
ncbi:MAG TPA: hypothetical protein VGO86_17840 [Candidatus Dormibacteraeota bacterium]|jgi:hypothetical protein